MPEKAQPVRMTAVARLLRSKSSEGLSYNEMAHLARTHGYKVTSSRLNQIANGDGQRLSDNTLRAIAAIVGVSPMAIAILEAEDMYMQAPDLPTAASH